MPWTRLAPSIWESVRQAEAYQWPVSADALAALRNILLDRMPRLDNESLARGGGIGLREAIGATLRDADAETRLQLHKWIVCDWGRITKHPPDGWANQLHPYDGVAVQAFIAGMRINRMASWSKILAFADHTQYAIYDSWTATALNIALYRLDATQRFRVPPGRSYIVGDVRRRLGRHRMRGACEGYLSYLTLLRAIVDARLAPDILTAEQTLFANARVLAIGFLRE